MNSQRGEAITAVLLILVLIGGGLFVLKPKWTHGDSRRATESTVTTERLNEAQTKQGATAAASIVKIGEVIATAPESLEKEFIAREVPVALASLPAPDPLALVEAERRKVAVMEGRLAEAATLYNQALKRADTLERERAAALAAKRASDAELAQVAAERLGSERLMNWAIAAAVLAGLLYIYVKVTHISPSALAEAVKDIKGGTQAITALDGVASRLQQRIVRLLST